MKRFLVLVLLFISVVSFAQTSRYTTRLTNSAGQKITTGTVELLPYGNTYPTGALALTHDRDGIWYRVSVPNGEYSLYYNGVLVASYARIWIGENKLTLISNFFNALFNFSPPSITIPDTGYFRLSPNIANVQRGLSADTNRVFFARGGNGKIDTLAFLSDLVDLITHSIELDTAKIGTKEELIFSDVAERLNVGSLFRVGTDLRFRNLAFPYASKKIAFQDWVTANIQAMSYWMQRDSTGLIAYQWVDKLLNNRTDSLFSLRHLKDSLSFKIYFDPTTFAWTPYGVGDSMLTVISSLESISYIDFSPFTTDSGDVLIFGNTGAFETNPQSNLHIPIGNITGMNLSGKQDNEQTFFIGYNSLVDNQWHAFQRDWFTQNELQNDYGLAAVHWGNITNTPAFISDESNYLSLVKLGASATDNLTGTLGAEPSILYPVVFTDGKFGNMNFLTEPGISEFDGIDTTGIPDGTELTFLFVAGGGDIKFANGNNIFPRNIYTKDGTYCILNRYDSITFVKYNEKWIETSRTESSY